jgi:DNA-binding beta-propeller fold protein YncE
MLQRLIALSLAGAAGLAAADGLELPESIVQDADTGTLYCSNVGGAQATLEAVVAKDGNGFISRLKPDGTVDTLKFIPQAGDPALNGPKGLCIIGTLLWVADIDRVVAYDLENGKQVSEFSLADKNVTFANDLVEVDGDLLLTDTAGDQVLQLKGADRGTITAAEVIEKGVFGGANGIATDGKGAIYLATYPVGTMPKAGGMVRAFKFGESLDNRSKLGFAVGQWDGVAVAPDGTVYASDWTSGGLWKLAPGGKPEQIAKDLQGPADFCLLKDGSAILVPEMGASKITTVKLK